MCPQRMSRRKRSGKQPWKKRIQLLKGSERSANIRELLALDRDPSKILSTSHGYSKLPVINSVTLSQAQRTLPLTVSIL